MDEKKLKDMMDDKGHRERAFMALEHGLNSSPLVIPVDVYGSWMAALHDPSMLHENRRDAAIALFEVAWDATEKAPDA